MEGRIADPGIRYLLMDTDYLVLAVSVNHPYAKRGMITLSELKKERMNFALAQLRYTQSVHGAFGKQQYEPERVSM